MFHSRQNTTKHRTNHVIKRFILPAWFFCLSLTGLCGCDTLGYYSQGIKGHLQLVSQIQPINKVLHQPETPQKTRDLLKLAQQARVFAVNQLGLPDNQSYRGFADLNRKQVTWNVVATRPLSLQPYLSCFPVVGCLSYRGYFTEQGAKRFAHALEQQGYETFIGDSTAYSTLGWFADPIVSPMLQYGDIRLVETLFHELAHQRLYIENDSNFNEAFATAVGQNGTREWLRHTHPEKLQAYNRYLRRQADFLNLLEQTSQRLKTLYQSDLTDAQKRIKKQDYFSRLQEDYRLFKQQHQGYTGYDKWFEKPVNNPRLALLSVYHKLVPTFERWLDACDRDFPRFYKQVELLSGLTKAQRQQALNSTPECLRRNAPGE